MDDGSITISRYLSPTSTKFMQSPNKKDSYSFDEILEIHEKGVIYVRTFLNTYDNYIDPYRNGKFHETLYKPLKFHEVYGWVLPRQTD